jgi:hypothetical protein
MILHSFLTKMSFPLDLSRSAGDRILKLPSSQCPTREEQGFRLGHLSKTIRVNRTSTSAAHPSFPQPSRSQPLENSAMTKGRSETIWLEVARSQFQADDLDAALGWVG